MGFLAESFEGSFMVNVRYFFVNTSDLISDVSIRRITKECFSFFFNFCLQSPAAHFLWNLFLQLNPTL